MSISKNAGAGPLRSALASGLKDRIDEPCIGRDTLLTLACRNGNTECIRLLLQQGAAVDAPCAPPKATPLYLAVQEGHAKAAKLLLDADADVTDCLGDGLTPLSVAVHQGTTAHADCAKLLLAAPQQVAIGAKKLNDCDEHGVNLLLKASYMGHDEIVRQLVNAGASARHTDTSGASALLLACRHGHGKCAQLLVKAGAPLDAAIDDGGTALHFACRGGFTECVRLLLMSKANPDHAPGQSGTSALHVACQAGQLECVKVLLEAKASPNAVDKDGVPPLFLAEAMGHQAVATLLGRAGATRPSATARFGGSVGESKELAAGATRASATEEQPTGTQRDQQSWSIW